MAVVVVGLNHRTAPVDVVENVAVGPARLAEFLEALLKSEHISEAVVLSTCMRTEIYVEALRFHGAVADVRSTLCRLSGVSNHDLSGHLFEYFDDSVYRHLFRVAAGVESAVLGEGEVLGQVARSWAEARDLGASRSVLNTLFRHAVRVGKRARRETAIAQGTTSIGQAAVLMAEAKLGGLSNKKVLLVGTGEMGEGMAMTVNRTSDIGELVVCNRTETKAIDLAERLSGRHLPFDELSAAMHHADLILTSTGSPEPVLSVADVRQAVSERIGEPLVIVDMGVPRDVQPGVADIDGVTVLDLDALDAFTSVARNERADEVELVEAVVIEEIGNYLHEIQQRSVVPLLTELRERAEVIRIAEVDKYAHRLEGLSDEQSAVVEQLTKTLLAKLLHEPTVRLKDLAGSAEGDRVAAVLRELLDTDR